MTSETDFGLYPPVRVNACKYLLNTEEQAAEAFYSHEQLIRQAGRYGIVPLGAPPPCFEWTPSPSFGHPHKVPIIGGGMRSVRDITTSCLRTEFIMISYTYVIQTVRHVLRQYEDFMTRIRGAQKLTKGDTEVARGFCKRLYNVYLVLVDRVKINVLLLTLGSIVPACAELSIHTVNALIAYVAGLHSVVMFTFLEITQEAKNPVSFDVRRDVFAFVALCFGRAYSIFTRYVWSTYTAPVTADKSASVIAPHAPFQRYLLGATLFYQAKSIISAVQYEKMLSKPSAATILVLSRRADYILGLLCSSQAFGFFARAQQLTVFTQAWVSETYSAVSPEFPYRDRITTPEKYAEGERFAALAFEGTQPLGLLYNHHKKDGRMFRSNPLYCSLPRACLFQ